MPQRAQLGLQGRLALLQRPHNGKRTRHHGCWARFLDDAAEGGILGTYETGVGVELERRRSLLPPTDAARTCLHDDRAGPL